MSSIDDQLVTLKAAKQRLYSRLREEGRLKTAAENEMQAVRTSIVWRRMSHSERKDCKKKLHEVLEKYHEVWRTVDAADEKLTKQIAELKRRQSEEERESNEQPDVLALRYSRACSICSTPNPRKRAVLTSCGHVICTPCAEQTARERPVTEDRQFLCTICRKQTNFVEMFEDVDEEGERGGKAWKANDAGDEKKPIVGVKRQIKEEEREAKVHPDALAHRYSRTCPVCFTPNPRRRAVLTSCGHVTCTPCVERMTENMPIFPCPTCRKETRFVQLFEDVEDNGKRGGKRRRME